MKRSATRPAYRANKYAKLASGAVNVAKAFRAAYKGSPLQRKTQQKNSGLTGITTFQKDVKQVYRYKRAPRKLRRKWKRSRKAYVSNTLKSVASRKYHYTGNMTWATAIGTQAWFGWMNYGVNGTGGVDGSGDMADIQTRLDLENRAQGTASDQAEGGPNARRYFFDHMRARIVLTNTGTTPIFWEIYECVARKDIPVNFATTLQSIYTGVANAVYQGLIGPQTAGSAGGPNSTNQISAASRPTKQTIGVTPFQFRDYCQKFKILKVTRLQAAPGNTVSFDASQGRNVTVNWDDYQDLICKKGLTKVYLVRQWGTVQAGSPPQESASSSVCEVEKDYNCKLLDTHTPQLNYFTYTNAIEG